MALPEEPPPPAAPGFGRLRYATQRSIGIPVIQSCGDGTRRRLFEDGRHPAGRTGGHGRDGRLGRDLGTGPAFGMPL